MPGDRRRVWNSLIRQDVRALLDRIQHPTLIVHGAQSHLYGADTADHLVEALPHARAVRFEQLRPRAAPRGARIVQRHPEGFRGPPVARPHAQPSRIHEETRHDPQAQPRLQLGSALAALAAATPAFAQDEPAPRRRRGRPRADAPTTSEIVVTARRREESLQDVPIAVTAYSGEALERQGATDITELNDTTPNVTLETRAAPTRP